MHLSESFDFHGARIVGQTTVTLLPCSCSTALSLRAGLVSTAHPLFSSAATDLGALLCHLADGTCGKGESPQGLPDPCLAAVVESSTTDRARACGPSGETFTTAAKQ